MSEALTVGGKTRVDLLVIGGGLAGSVCAWQARFRGETVLIVDKPELSSSSRVAGGLLNPIAGQRFTVDPEFAANRRDAMELYRRIERRTAAKLLHICPQWRLFRDAKDRENWLRRARDPSVARWHGPLVDEAQLPAELVAPWGGFEVPQAAWLDMARLIAVTREHIPFLARQVRDEDIECSDDALRLGDIVARRAVLSRGFRETFAHVPAPRRQLCKGELLVLSIPDLPRTHSINKGGWLLPVGDGLWKAGATYDRQNIDERATSAGRRDVLRRVAGMTRCPVELVDHLVGVRPVLQPRGAVVLKHPTAPLWVVNGLGSKGSLLAPTTCARLGGDPSAGRALP